jgi:flagellar hook assembly protein FlgD
VATEEIRHGPLRAQLRPNVPNPFNPRTSISFSLTEDATVSLEIHDLAGRLVRVLESNRHRSQGDHTVTWDGRNDRGETVASGVYVYRLRAGEYEASRLLTLLK